MVKERSSSAEADGSVQRDYCDRSERNSAEETGDLANLQFFEQGLTIYNLQEPHGSTAIRAIASSA